MSKLNAFFLKWLILILKYYKAIGHSFLFIFSLLNTLIQVKSLFIFRDMTYNLPFSKISFPYNNKYQHPRPSWCSLDTHHRQHNFCCWYISDIPLQTLFFFLTSKISISISFTVFNFKRQTTIISIGYHTWK